MELRAKFNLKQGKLNKVLRIKSFVYVYDTQDRRLQYTCHLAGETCTARTGRARAHGYESPGGGDATRLYYLSTIQIERP
jgi:hypothetical protein